MQEDRTRQEILQVASIGLHVSNRKRKRKSKGEIQIFMASRFVAVLFGCDAAAFVLQSSRPDCGSVDHEHHRHSTGRGNGATRRLARCSEGGAAPWRCECAVIILSSSRTTWHSGPCRDIHRSCSIADDQNTNYQNGKIA